MMKKIGIILITAAIVAGCTERELIMPDAPSNPDREGLIVPSATVSGMVSAEETMARYAAPNWMIPTTRGTTRAASYPYVIANKDGKKSIIVTKDADGQMAGVRFHYSWLQTPQHLDGSKDDAVAVRFEVAQENGGSFQIGDNTACPAPWRRPTVREWYVITQVKGSLEVSPFDQEYYLTATETEWGVKGWCDKYANWKVINTELVNYANVRCVRDAYPYVTTNATGQRTVIVSQDEYGTSGAPMHSPWTVTPVHNELSSLNSVSHRFEYGDRCTEANTGVAPTRDAQYYWNDAVTLCAKYFKNSDKSDLGTWRLPTEKELEISFGYFNSGIEWYWSATEVSSNTTLAYVFKGSAFANNKSDDCFVRCVRDLTLALPGSSGSPSFTLTAFAGATEPTNWQTAHFPATDVKATATGFEMSTPRYFPANGAQKVYFYATAPACTNYAQGSASVEPKATYSFADGKKDVMWAKDVRGIAKNSDPTKQQQPSFLFQHMLKQVQFKVKADGTFETGKKLTKITVKSVYTQVSIGMVSGSPSWSVTTDIPLDFTATPITLTTTAADAGMLMFDPANTFKVEAVVDGVTYPDIPVTLTGTNAGAAGTANVVTLTFKRQQVEATATIGAWVASVDGGTIDVN